MSVHSKHRKRNNEKWENVFPAQATDVYKAYGMQKAICTVFSRKLGTQAHTAPGWPIGMKQFVFFPHDHSEFRTHQCIPTITQ